MKQPSKQKRRPLRLTRKVFPSHIEAEIKTTSDEPYKTRLRTILLLHKGKSCQEIAETLVLSVRSIRNGIHTYNDSGEEGLQTKPSGRPKGRMKWENTPFENLTKAISGNSQYWSVRLMTEWLAKNEKITVPESTVWYRITQIGYSHKSSRPHPYKGDPEKQNAFKKGV